MFEKIKFYFDKYIYIVIIPLIFATIIPYYNSFKIFIMDNGYFLLITYSFFFILIISFLLYLLLPPSGGPTPDGKTFKGVKKLETEEAWPREDLSDDITEKIKDKDYYKGKLCLISGVSGAGKSLLISTQVIQNLKKDGWECFVIEDYINLQTKIGNFVSQKISSLTTEEIRNLNLEKLLSTSQKFFFVFDQIEQLSTIKEMEWTKEFLEKSLKNPNIRCAIIVRQDFYYHIRFLGNLLPSPSEAIDIPGLGLEREDHELIKEKLEKVAETETMDLIIKNLEIDVIEIAPGSSLQEVKKVLPLELQMIGLMLEVEEDKRGKTDNKYYKQNLFGKNGLINKYFSSYLTASPNPKVAKSVLYALSADKVLRKSISLEDLTRITYYDKEEVKRVLNFFVDEKVGLVIEPTTGMYEWTHDSLASGFREFSGVGMDAAQRDNITYLVDKIQTNDKNYSSILPIEDIKSRITTCNWMFGISLFLVITRIFFGDFFIHSPITKMLFKKFYTSNELISQSVIKSFYFPFGIIHLLWAYYICMTNKLFFVRLADNSKHIPWWVVFVVGVPCLIITCFAPFLWSLAMAITGVIIGLNYLVITLNKNISKQTKSKFLILSIAIIFISVLLFGLTGLDYMYGSPMLLSLLDNVSFLSLQSEIWFYGSSVIVCIIFFILSWIAIAKHATQESISISLGLFDRSQRNH